MEKKRPLAFVVPVFNEIEIVKLGHVLLVEHAPEKIIYVDGGSSDGTFEFLETLASDKVLVIRSQKTQRAHQMNLGAQCAEGFDLCFLHCDIKLPDGASGKIKVALQEKSYGGFYKTYVPSNMMMRTYARLLNLIYFKMFKNGVGSNALFVRREFFDRLGGFPECDFMEDVLFSNKCKEAGEMSVITDPVRVSSRRYQDDGNLKRIYRNGRIMLKYFFGGISPEELKKDYYANE